MDNMEFHTGLKTNGLKATEKIPMPDLLKKMAEDITAPFNLRVKSRLMSEDEFIESHGSGTLRKNKRLDFHYKRQYLLERTAFEFGYGFECIDETHINWGQPITEGDCHAITETGWHADRYPYIAFPGDTFEVKYLHITNGLDVREGVGLIIRKTSAPFLPSNHVVYAIIAQVDNKTHQYLPAINPF